MIYDKSIPPCCAYCQHSKDIDQSDVLCNRYGPVTGGYKCRHYRYDALRRTPPKPAPPRRVFTKKDFDINSL